MTDSTSTDPNLPVELPAPSASRLAKTLLATAVAAAIILVTVVLPAEYGIDPTGIGRATGLDRLAGSAPASEALPQALPGLSVKQKKTFKTEARTLELRPKEQMELKMAMSEGDTVVFSWTVEGGPLYSDFHAEPYGELEGQAIRYEEGTAETEAHGSLHAPWDGHHGWYWRNDNETPLTVHLEVRGFYSVMKERRAE